MIRRRALTQTYNNCAETHFGVGVLSPFVFPLIAIATQAAFELGLSTSWWMQIELPKYPQGQSRTCYKES